MDKGEPGVPQGSILGPLLFIIYINDIVFASTVFKPTIYTDDAILYSTLNNLQDLNKRHNLNEIIKYELSKLSTYLKANKHISLNVNKSKLMVFCTPQKQIRLPTLHIDGSALVWISVGMDQRWYGSALVCAEEN